MSEYQSPMVRTLGTVAAVTEQIGSACQQFNKVGNNSDAATQTVPGLVGDVTCTQP